ncbi:DegT/DnrJ/EryC1/StrS aminotransferase [uncultured Caudovirales phage]|uniref:DegT/DnrJ/EryC1/StrS aminotransferase n=1 Tax=uncultured Caudovirales phage TaxID=2100421 RepID=A0A6J7XGQ4_9CAUD|nr:DegT/DnrJ/EryC1/StrS aminotransferase [uncultured Caudovirales phage]
MKNGSAVAAFEVEFARYVGARYAIALANGTATLHTALVALGITPGDTVAVPPLTMSATTLAVLHAGAVPEYRDVDAATWLMAGKGTATQAMSVSLYGLHAGACDIDDAAETLRPHNVLARFTSYSFQASKILSTGEGGMLTTNDEALATAAREFSSLGYRMRADEPRIAPSVLKDPQYERHHQVGYNYRMNDVTATEGLAQLEHADRLLQDRDTCAAYYRDAIKSCDWLTPQHVSDGHTHDYWAYALACDTPRRALDLATAVTRNGGERPYGAWRLSYDEPALTHLKANASCPNAESLQPRLMQFQTNNIRSAITNATALVAAIKELTD